MAPRRTTRIINASSSRPESIYNVMVAEALARDGEDDRNSRPSKKRKTHDSSNYGVYSQQVDRDDVSDSSHRPLQTVFDDSPSDGSEDDFDWEDVAIDSDSLDRVVSASTTNQQNQPHVEDVSVVLRSTPSNPHKNKTQISKRSFMTAVDRKLRLDIHKMHLCCLLVANHLRNAWCNDDYVKSKLKVLLSEKTQTYLNPAKHLSQFLRSRSFIDGLEQAIISWKLAFTVNARGIRRPLWRQSPVDVDIDGMLADIDDSANSRAEFRQAADRRTGSRDLGAQLFCALLRAVGVDARLVCSLQPLQFINTAVAVIPPIPKKPIIYADETSSGEEVTHGAAQRSMNAAYDGASSPSPHRIRRFGQATGQSSRDTGQAPAPPAKKKKIVDSPYPVYWVEAFNEAIQKWIPVDPMTTMSIAKPSKFEPPSSDQLNDMSYVIAFEDDGNAKDVTRRYAKAYNAKTRQRRVEKNNGGDRWWKKVMRLFSDGFLVDRDQVEIAELANKEASEPMPRNVQDFRGHPHFALERHLARHEVIHPKREVGKLGTGKGSTTIESIYRRQDVQMVRTADKWYRQGRKLKEGEQPLKHAAPRRYRRRPLSSTNAQDASSGSEHGDQPEAGAGLYAKFQTELYMPPPIIDGKIQKNGFGNLDVYVTSMIPPGGVHIPLTEGARAAKLLNVDYADCVTGFEFRGRHGTAITTGIVVAKEYREAIEETVRALRWQQEKAWSNKRTLEALRLWKRFWMGLQIRERIMSYADSEEDGNSRSAHEHDAKEELDKMEDEEEMIQEQGGFLPDAQNASSLPTTRTSHAPKQTFDDSTLLTESSQELRNWDYFPPSITSPWDRHLAVSKPQSPSKPAARQVPPALIEDSSGGGFVNDEAFGTADDDVGGGGFLIEDDEDSGGFLPEGDAGDLAMKDVGEDDFAREGAGDIKAASDSDKAEQRLGPSSSVLYNGGAEHDSAVARTINEDGIEKLPSLSVADTHASNTILAASTPKARQEGDHQTGHGMARHGVRPEHAPASVAIASKSQKDQDEGDDEGEEDVSLLSEDPEDAEAEPDWLVNDIGF